jgi:hypothetical protein
LLGESFTFDRTMGFFKNIFGKKPQPEDMYQVILTDESVTVKRPASRSQSILWQDINRILLINTDEGPLQPDVWLALIGANSRCMIPQGSHGFEDVYEIVSRYEGFNFENVIKSMSTADNAEFVLWAKK